MAAHAPVSTALRPRSALARATLRIDGCLCLTSGLALVAAAPLAGHLGAIPPLALAAVGAVTAAYGAVLLAVARREHRLRGAAGLASLLNVVTALLLLAVLVGGWPALTALGHWAALAMTDAVIVLAVAQFVAWRRLA